MSTNDPGQPEYLGSEAPGADSVQPASHRRRRGVLAGVAVGVLAAVGVGTYGVLQLMSSGSAPASAVPAGAIGYLSVDLDPSAAQKIEAFKILRKFPALKSQLKLGGGDDLRSTFFRQVVQSNGDCPKLTYARDVEPWLGNRVAVAAVPGAGKRVLPLVALQVTDLAKATAGVRAIADCSGDNVKLGVSSVGDYLLLTEKQADADRMAADAKTATLEDDADFTTWMGRAGDPGIVTMYASKDAPAAIERAAGGRSAALPKAGRSKQLASAFTGFEGAVGVVRFHDGAIEVEFSSKGAGSTLKAAPTTDVASLPATTAAALAVGLPDGWLDSSLGGLKSAIGPDYDAMLRQGEQMTGLQLPGDVATLFGQSLSVSVDSGADLAALSKGPDPSTVPAGIRIRGDAAKITAIIDKLKKAAGPGSGIVRTGSSGDLVAVGADPAYVASLLKQGDLGSQSEFTSVVPQASRATSVLYVNFDAGSGWSEKIADLISDKDPKVRANVAPLSAFGASAWVDGSHLQHALLRLATN